MQDAIVIGGYGSEDLGESLAKKFTTSLIIPQVRTFNDAEIKVTLNSDVSGKHAIIVQRLFPDPNRRIMQLLFLLSRVNSIADDITLVLPYMAYARQHKAFLDGEAVSLDVIFKLLRSSGAKRIVTVDIHHNGNEQDGMDLRNVSAVPSLAKYISEEFSLTRPVVVSPDEGGIERAKTFAKTIGAEEFSFKKERNRLTGEIKTSASNIDVKGRDAIIVDDMISTGGTVVESSHILREKGAKSVMVACSHALLIGEAAERIKMGGTSQIIATNTILNEYSRVDVTDLIAEQIKE